LEVSDLLFSAAEDWCQARGLDILIGPKGLLRSQGVGLLVDGFDQLPAVGIPYHLPYYQALIEGYGFTKSHDHLSGYLDQRLDAKINLIAEKVLSRGNFEVKGFKKASDITEWIPIVDEVQQKAFSDNSNFYPASPEEFNLLAKISSRWLIQNTLRSLCTTRNSPVFLLHIPTSIDRCSAAKAGCSHLAGFYS